MNVITIQEMYDKTVARSMLAYDTNELAASALYSTMASSLVSEPVKSVVCTMIDDNGVIVTQEKWIKPDLPEEKE